MSESLGMVRGVRFRRIDASWAFLGTLTMQLVAWNASRSWHNNRSTCQGTVCDLCALSITTVPDDHRLQGTGTMWHLAPVMKTSNDMNRPKGKTPPVPHIPRGVAMSITSTHHTLIPGFICRPLARETTTCEKETKGAPRGLEGHTLCFYRDQGRPSDTFSQGHF